MTNYNVIRLLSFGLLISLSALGSSGQEVPTLNGFTQQGSEPALVAAKPKILAELPPKPPKVTCNGGQLTISAENSTLGSVLAAVHACAGVSIDLPEGSAGSRTYEELGPGPVRQVLEALLSATEFNYVIESSEANPQKVENVLLMLRASDTPTTPGSSVETGISTPARRAWLLTQKNGRATAVSNDESRQITSDITALPIADDAAVAPVDNSGANEVPAPPGLAGVSGEVVQAPLGVGGTSLDGSANASQSKGTADKITDMQQLFEQRRQMIESQTPPKAR